MRKGGQYGRDVAVRASELRDHQLPPQDLAFLYCARLLLFDLCLLQLLFDEPLKERTATHANTKDIAPTLGLALVGYVIVIEEVGIKLAGIKRRGAKPRVVRSARIIRAERFATTPPLLPPTPEGRRPNPAR